MKYIFDFDRVLFNTSLFITGHIYPAFAELGVSKEEINRYFKEKGLKHFSLKGLIKNFSLEDGLYTRIMSGCKTLVNEDLIALVKRLGKENCYMLTFGEHEFQKEKIDRSGIADLFSEIFIVPNSKADVLRKICARHKDETVIFLDDKEEHFKGLGDIPNLRTILFDEQGLAKLRLEMQ